MKPLLKYVGGKRRLLPQLLKILEAGDYDRIIEPFVGGGAFFFGAEFTGRLIIGDTSKPLINFYRWVRDDPQTLAKMIAGHGAQYLGSDTKVREVLYYAWRTRFNDYDSTGESCQQAALFYVLNRTGFQGLWRINKAGAMNVPHGHYKTPRFASRDEIREASDLLQATVIRCAGFGNTLAQVKGSGDFVYCDPPYFDTFTGYTAGGFSHEDQEELASILNNWVRHTDAKIVASNRDCKEVRKLYPLGLWKRIKVGTVQRIAPHNKGNKPELLMVSR